MVNFQPSKESSISSKITCMFKDAVRPTQNDEFYLLTDTEGNISIICFWNPIEETAQNSYKKNEKSEGNKFIHCV